MSTPLAPQHQKGTEQQREQRPADSQTQGRGTAATVQLKAHLADKDYDEQAAILQPPGPWAHEGATTEALQAKGPMDGAGSVHAAAAHGVQGGGGALPHSESIQAAFGGHDVSGISAHVGGRAAEANQAMGASAYASGNDVAFASQPDLHTAAHEAAHIVQQRGGVSLAGGVGKAGDGYEAHADKVADAVVSGQSAEPLLDKMSGGSKREGVQQMAVQRAPASTSSVSSDEAAVVADRAADRSMTLEDQNQYDRGGRQTGTARVNRDRGASMAENPAFEADAMVFEKALAQRAFTDGNGPASAMAAKARAYLLEKVGGAWLKTNARLEGQLSKIGSDNAAWSGSVGKNFEDLVAALDTGNCSVKMMHLDNVYTHIILPDIKADPTAIETLISGITDIEAREKAEELVSAVRVAGRVSEVAYAVPSGSEVEGKDGARAYRHKEDLRTTKKTSRQVPRTEKTVGSVGVALDPAELKVQEAASGETSSSAMKLQWEEGAEKWALNEENKWVFLMRQLSLPLVAGPSGTTNKLMNMGQLLGMAPTDTRLAAMGYLMPPSHHSLVEIMAAAAAFGADYIAGRQIYTSIAPYSTTALKAMGGGKFPHETHGDKTVSGDTVVDGAGP
jgi:hypothetical protein